MIRQNLKRSIVISLVAAALTAGCATTPAPLQINDTTLSGDPNIAQAFYGKYRVLKGPGGRRLDRLEIDGNTFNKPVFHFFDKKNKLLAEDSPRGCGLMAPRYMVIGTMSCGFTNVGIFGKSDFPYIEISSAKVSLSNPDQLSKFNYAGESLEFKRNWYELKIQWSRGMRQEKYLIEKIETAH